VGYFWVLMQKDFAVTAKSDYKVFWGVWDGLEAAMVSLDRVHETDFRFVSTVVEFIKSDPSLSRYKRSYPNIKIHFKIQRRWEN